MASQSSRPRMTLSLPRPTRGQIVWWVVGGVVAVAAFASVAFAGGDAETSSSGPGTVEDPVVATDDADLPLAA